MINSPPARIALLTIVVLITGSLAEAQPVKPVNIGDAPQIEFTSIDGKKISLKEYRGKVVIIDFWATWCPPCMHELPHMLKLNKKYRNQGLQFLGISLDRKLDALKRVVKKRQIPWPQSFGSSSNILAQRFGVFAIPTTALFSRQGKLLWLGHPYRLQKQLDKLFKNQKKNKN